jgi:hypothetical protein
MQNGWFNRRCPFALSDLWAWQGVRVNRKELCPLCKEERLPERKRGGRKRALGNPGADVDPSYLFG